MPTQAREAEGSAVTDKWIPEDTFAARLVLIRHAKGNLTQAEAAARCGLDDGSWSNWEHGVRPREFDNVVRAISKGLKVDRDWLAWGSEDQGRYLSSQGELPFLDEPLEEPHQEELLLSA